MRSAPYKIVPSYRARSIWWRGSRSFSKSERRSDIGRYEYATELRDVVASPAIGGQPVFTIILLLVAQQCLIALPYLAVVPIGDVIVRAQCLGGFKR